jgi:RNA polymerase sigma-70 factor (ECF subfamily)
MFSPELAFHALYSSHHGWLISWLRARLDDSADAADLAQGQMGLSLRLVERYVALVLYTALPCGTRYDAYG